jgi:hypothetical protein
MKEVLAHQAQREGDDLNKKLEDAEQRDKDATSDLQAVVEGKSFIISPS